MNYPHRGLAHSPLRQAVLLTCFLKPALPQPENEPQDVTYCQLANDPSAFSDKRIRIRAIYAYMFEVSALRAPTCCAGPESLETPGPIVYGSGTTVSPGKRFAQFVLGTPAKRAVPVMREFESQKTSVALPPNRV